MRVQCDVCGGEPAAVLCCADEAALCSSCDRRVHRANKLAGKHRRLPLLHPSGCDNGDTAAAAGPLCDVCKERRGLVFCVEDRAILCADCDDPIHSVNNLTAKHSRFLLVGAKLSAALVDLAPLSPDCSGGSGEPDDVAAACAQDSSTNRSPVLESNNNNNGGSSISDYLTNICPGWRVDDLLFDDAAFSTAANAGRGEHEQVPSMDANLFDAVAAWPEKRDAWAGALGLEEVPAAMPASAAAKAAKQGRVRERYWNSDSDSDVFAVPEISPPAPPTKRARPSSFWCF
ncbi:B-box zinc finger protein 20-like [Phragmites australis]|uniref:B-box zinc finger protein 20-like n=1 Tax=Phragmites australis TaxID=29695 RepID=UPI002D774517|nr:B-box zinc finger protein 20-like [Phragmites australis]